MSSGYQGNCDRNKAPCKDCTSRHGPCHDSCERYKAWLDHRHAEDEYERTLKSMAGVVAHLRFKRNMSLIKGGK